MEFQNSCRICESRENLRVIASNGDDVNFAMLRAIEISIVVVADRVSGFICLECTHKLKEFYDFKSLYEATYNKFKQKCPARKWSADSTDGLFIRSATITTESGISFVNDGNLHGKEDISKCDQVEPVNDLQESAIKNEDIEILKDEVLKQGEKKYSREIDVEYQNECGVSLKHSWISMPNQQLQLNSDECAKKSEPVSKQNEYKCEKCGESFEQLSEFQKHKGLHSNEKFYQCEECAKIFTHRQRLKEHKELHWNPERYQCEICGKCLCNQLTLNDHKITQHSHSNLHVCEECGKSFKLKRYLLMHETLHLAQELYKCDECDKTFQALRTYKHHKARHLNPDAYKCEKCAKTFTRPYELKFHMRLHSNPDLYKCEICEKSFTKPRSLQKHKLLHIRPNKSDQIYKCNECEKSFKRLRYLKLHKARHSCRIPRNLFECDQCDRSFKKKVSWMLHKKLHLDPNLHKCDECGKSFVSASSLIVHKAWHSNPDMYTCSKCEKKFARPETLRKHKLLHSNPELFTKCDECGKIYSKSHSCRNLKSSQRSPKPS